MKKLVIGLMTVLGVAFSSAETCVATTPNLTQGISVETGVSYNGLTNVGGLKVRDDAFNYSLILGTDVGGGSLSAGLDLFETDDGTDTQIDLSWNKGVDILGQAFDATVSFQKVESDFGGWEEVGLGLAYSHEWADVSATVWHELGSSADYGVELTASRIFATPVANLSVIPFVTTNFANSYNAVEVGTVVDYDFGNGLSVAAKAAYNHNDVDTSSSYSLDHDWNVGLGFTYKF
tara:strand:- start:222 stop:923 length:702 start_codon:yes stop_codon:yes gene_type:complete